MSLDIATPGGGDLKGARERFKRLESLFLGALEQPVAERPSWLSRHAGEKALAESVLALLAAQGESLAMAGTLGGPGDLLRPGSRIGDYTLSEWLGQGASGAVYRATGPDGAEVAIKVLRSEQAGAWRARFEREARLLQRLDHPGIVRLLDHGLLEGPNGEAPYLVLELVPEALSLRAYARERGLKASQRLALLIELGQALSYAHERGIVHRDLKPENALVDGAGRLRLVDFGLGRELSPAEPSAATATGALLGSAWYMAPEQFEPRQDHDPRLTDIYAFGVIASELLAGRHPLPLAGCTLPELARRISDLPPAPLPAQLGRLRRPLSRVLDATLAKDPARRAQRIDAVVADLEAIQRGEAPRLRPPSALSRLRWTAERHPRTAAAVLVLALGLLSSSILAGYSALRAGRSAALQARERQVAEDALLALSRAVSSADLRNLERDPAAASRALDELEHLLRSDSQLSPSVRAQVAHLAAGRAIAQTRLEAAEEYLNLALRGWSETRPRQPAAEANSLALQAALFKELGRLEDMVSASRAAVALAAEAGDPAQALQLGADLTTALIIAGQLDEAQTEFERLWNATPPASREAFSAGHRLYSLKGGLAEARGDLPAALAAQRQTLELRLAALGPEDHYTQITRLSLAGILSALGQFDEAEQHAQSVRSERERRLGLEHPDTRTALAEEIAVIGARGDMAKTLPLWQELLQRTQNALPADHPQLLIIRHNLAHTLYQLSKQEPSHLDSALALTEINTAAWQARGEASHPEALNARQLQAVILQDQKREAEAQPILEALLADRQRVLGAHSSSALNTAGSLATNLERLGQLERSQAVQAEVLATAAAHYGEHEPNRYIGHARSARMAMRRGDFAAARTYVNTALNALTGHVDPRHTILQTLQRVDSDLTAAGH